MLARGFAIRPNGGPGRRVRPRDEKKKNGFPRFSASILYTVRVFTHRRGGGGCTWSRDDDNGGGGVSYTERVGRGGDGGGGGGGGGT